MCYKIYLLIILSIVFFNCASVSLKEDPANFRDEIVKITKQINDNPKDEKAMRDIGIIYFKTASYAKAKAALGKSFKINSADAETILYYGLSLEFSGQKDQALKVYSQYEKTSNLSPNRNQIEGRFHWLTRQKIQDEMRQVLLEETQLSEKNISPQKIAVFPFKLIKGNKDYSSLGKGLAEMIITDLSQVKKLQLIERARINALLEEMALGQTGLVEEKTAPRFGKLLGAGKIVHGNFSIADKMNLNLDAAFWDVVNNQYPKFTKRSDALENLFKLEKDIVFNIIDQIGIRLTMEEKKKIQQIPTKNLQAFLAYSIGLEMLDNGNFSGAISQFQKSNNLDPNFDAAKTKAQESGSINQASGSKETFAGTTQGTIISPVNTGELVADRLRNLNDNLGSGFKPGEDSREAGEEAANAGAQIGISDLPDPPPPPPQN